MSVLEDRVPPTRPAVQVARQVLVCSVLFSVESWRHRGRVVQGCGLANPQVWLVRNMIVTRIAAPGHKIVVAVGPPVCHTPERCRSQSRLARGLSTSLRNLVRRLEADPAKACNLPINSSVKG